MEILNDKLYLSREYMNDDENDWDYVTRLFNENAEYFTKEDD